MLSLGKNGCKICILKNLYSSDLRELIQKLTLLNYTIQICRKYLCLLLIFLQMIEYLKKYFGQIPNYIYIVHSRNIY